MQATTQQRLELAWQLQPQQQRLRLRLQPLQPQACRQRLPLRRQSKRWRCR